MLLIKEEYSFKQFACSVVTKVKKVSSSLFFSPDSCGAELEKHVSRSAVNSRNPE